MTKKNSYSILHFFRQNIAWISLVTLNIINLWLSYKLSPMSLRLSLVENQVSANTSAIVENRNEINNKLTILTEDTKDILKAIGDLKQYCHP